MKYYEFKFTMQPTSSDLQDVLSAVLGEAGFDSFVPTVDGNNPLLAYIKVAEFDEKNLASALRSFPVANVEISYTMTEAEDKDWNKLWEENYFQPLVVDGKCVVYGTMHKDVPTAEYNIIINPKMSFGTGHHATTSQMLSEILKTDVRGFEVLDMGCGTSILAILAKMCGAAHCVAIDNDEWCVDNSIENIALNGVENIDVELGDANVLKEKGPFDLVLANINRNILLADMGAYTQVMKSGAQIFMSGFYEEDVPVLKEEALRQNLHLVRVHSLNRWACAVFEKV